MIIKANSAIPEHIYILRSNGSETATHAYASPDPAIGRLTRDKNERPPIDVSYFGSHDVYSGPDWSIQKMKINYEC